MTQATTLKWFKIYVKKSDDLKLLLFQEESNNIRSEYFDNLRLVSEVYYNVNYYLEKLIYEYNEQKKDCLNKRIGVIYFNIENLKKIIKKSKYTPDSNEEKRAYDILVDQLKRVKKTIQNYFILLQEKEKETNVRPKRSRKEINYKEDELEEEEKITNDDQDYEPENEEDKYQEKRDKKYDKKYEKYVVFEDEQEDFILEVDKNNPNHLRFIYV